MSPPRKVYELGVPNLTFDKSSGRYRYRNPLNDKRAWLGRDRDAALAQARRLNEAVRTRAADVQSIRAGFVTVRHAIEAFVEHRAPEMPWEPATRANHLAAYALYDREFGAMLVAQLSRGQLDQWIRARCPGRDCRRKHRLRLTRLLDYARLRGWVEVNEASAIPEYVSAARTAGEERVRQRLDVPTFWRIHDAAPLFLQVAMQLSLLTLQSRAEVCNAQREDIVDGRLRFIRRKSAGKSDRAFIAVGITPAIASVLSLGLSSGIASPYIVHHRPRSLSREARATRPHWSYVPPQRLSIAFARARDRAGVTAEHSPGAAPTFHEIRSLGARLMRSTGSSTADISALATHTDPRVTEIYLEDPRALLAEHYRAVDAPLALPARQ